MDALPPCGIYVTTAPIGGIPAGRFVYFHNHGDPGPGIYLPSTWRGNRARFEARGHLLGSPADAASLAALPREGLYRVAEVFHCCDRQCRRFEPDSLVQLGYDAAAEAILFTPEWVDGRLAIPERGTRIERDRIGSLRYLHVAVADTPVHDDGAEDVLLH
ncbi:MAG: hypothetical protein KF729_02680 [Sandaracinaceae bacterium]|nr:hypothetical protein [Sandaracinaceae bacterium]